MPTPLIGITPYRQSSSSGISQLSIGETYTSAILHAGACPVMIPLGLPEPRTAALVARLDGILFSGGGDVQPERYGSQPHPLVTGVDTDRDEVEINLMNAVLQAGKPFLGICRGLQVINVAMGGSLYEDILDQHPQAIRHHYYPDWPRNYLAHTVQVDENSRLRTILGAASVQVNSLHHQGVRRLAPRLCAAAYAPDGVIEAFELSDHPFGLAVQWHPECLQEHLSMQTLFHSFVQAAAGKRSGPQ